MKTPVRFLIGSERAVVEQFDGVADEVQTNTSVRDDGAEVTTLTIVRRREPPSRAPLTLAEASTIVIDHTRAAMEGVKDDDVMALLADHAPRKWGNQVDHYKDGQIVTVTCVVTMSARSASSQSS